MFRTKYDNLRVRETDEESSSSLSMHGICDKRLGDSPIAQSKIVMLGDSGVGKTSLCKKLFGHSDGDPVSTISTGLFLMDSYTGRDNEYSRAVIWDTAGMEKFSSLTKGHLRGADAVILVYDVTAWKSFENCKMWLDRVGESCESTMPRVPTCVLVGNKSDLGDYSVSQSTTRPEVERSSGMELAVANGLAFVETSAKEGSNVEELFNIAIKLLEKDRADCSGTHPDLLDVEGMSVSVYRRITEMSGVYGSSGGIDFDIFEIEAGLRRRKDDDAYRKRPEEPIVLTDGERKKKEEEEEEDRCAC
jgi:small GTP-binding protein